MIDLDSLLAPVSEEDPCGEDLEYDPAFTEMELASVGREEQEMGDSVMEAEEPDWPDLRDKALAVCQRSKDLRAAVHLTTALLKTDGLPGFAQGVQLIQHYVDDHWEGLHPRLDPDDDLDPTIRVNTIAQLADTSAMMRYLRQTPLTESRVMGRFGMRDIMIARGELTLPEGSTATPPDMASINGAFQDTDNEVLGATAAAVDQTLERVVAITASVTNQVGSADTADLAELEKLLKDMKRVIGNFVGGEEDDVGEIGDRGLEAAPMGAVAAAPGMSAAPGVISNSNEVLNAIDRICDYYTRQEPSSPVPVLLQRARRLVAADFLTIVKDLAPDGVAQVNLVGGIKEEAEYSEY